MNQRYRVAIICGSLTQGGGGRYTYELCRAIDKARFEVNVITIAPWKVKRHFYADHIRRLGIRIREILPLFHFRRLPALLRVPALAGQDVYRSLLLPRLLAKYDLIAPISLDYCLNVESMLPRQRVLVVHLVNHLHQYTYNRYLDWPHNRPGLFICMDRSQEREMTASLGSLVSDKVTVQLPIDISQFRPITRWPQTRNLIIGCFMRIEWDRECRPLLRAFAHVVKNIDAEMRFYGRGDVSELSAEAGRLGISDRVKFPGHVSDIRRAIVDDRVTFGWLTACDDVIGYAGIELALLAVPTFFYNVEANETSAILAQTGGAVHAYKTESELAEATVAVWKCPDSVYGVGWDLRRFAETRHNSKWNIRQIESFYERAIQNTRQQLARQSGRARVSIRQDPQAVSTGSVDTGPRRDLTSLSATKSGGQA